MSVEDMLDELSEMNKALEGDGDGSPESPENPPAENKEEKPGEKPGETPDKDKQKETPSEPGKEKAGEGTPSGSGEKKDEKAESAGDLQKTVDELRSELALLKAQVSKPTEKPEEHEEPPAEPKVEDQDFVKDIDLDEVTRDSSELNKLLNQVYKRGVIDSRTAIASELPNMVDRRIKLINDIQELGREFYRVNEDLKKHPEVVRTVYGEISAKDPKRPLVDILNDVADEARKRLGLAKPNPKDEKMEPGSQSDQDGSRSGDAPEGRNKSVPNLPSKGGGVGRPSGGGEVDKLQSQINEMNEALER